LTQSNAAKNNQKSPQTASQRTVKHGPANTHRDELANCHRIPF